MSDTHFVAAQADIAPSARIGVGQWLRAQTASGHYIAGCVYDWCFFLLPPLVALGVGIGISGTALANDYWTFFGYEVTTTGLAIGVLIHAHLVIVFFRSHGNQQIFRLHPVRFVAVPVLLYVGIMTSSWVAVGASVLATFWDVYHSAMQTFGFARLYDRRAGNDPAAGRRLDWWLNVFLYVGPILAGAAMLSHINDFEKFEEVGSAFLTSVPAYMVDNQRYYAWAVIAAGTVFLCYYVFAQWRLHKQGHVISPQKVYLLASTGFCSIYTWGFNSWGEAFFIINLFHALQYFGMVWWAENRNMARLFGVAGHRLSKLLTLMIFVGVALSYGVWVEALDTSFQSLWAITVVVSLMHFWYDGFIWSVRKRQV